jgi:hypothetical protein
VLLRCAPALSFQLAGLTRLHAAGFFVTVDMFGPPDRAGASQLTGAGAPPGSAQGGLERDCERLAHGLRMFEDAWHLVGLATSMLLDKVTLAGQLTVRVFLFC